MRLEGSRALATVAMIALAALAAGAPKGAAQSKSMASAKASDSTDVSGYWELSFDSRKVPPADLAAGVTKEMLEEHVKADAHAIRWCNSLGTPFVMDSGRPLDIREGTREIIITSETTVAPRHLYLDRTTHTSPDIFDTTTDGDSIALWEGDTLAVDTIGFDAKKGLMAIPGGGFRTANSHLTERYRLLENGSVLSVTFTWEDPEVYRTPHTYEFRYYRLPKQYEPMPAAKCDPYDDVRAKFLETPIASTPDSSRH
jgi:hypothetical protein